MTELIKKGYIPSRLGLLVDDTKKTIDKLVKSGEISPREPVYEEILKECVYSYRKNNQQTEEKKKQGQKSPISPNKPDVVLQPPSSAASESKIPSNPSTSQPADISQLGRSDFPNYEQRKELIKKAIVEREVVLEGGDFFDSEPPPPEQLEEYASYVAERTSGMKTGEVSMVVEHLADILTEDGYNLADMDQAIEIERGNIRFRNRRA